MVHFNAILQNNCRSAFVSVVREREAGLEGDEEEEVRNKEDG